jgi:hypothetical protein
MHLRIWLAIALLSSGPAFAVCDDNSQGSNDDAPYICSDHVTSVSWNCPGRIEEAAGSDLFPVAWATDGNLYTSFGDGNGFLTSDAHWKTGESDPITVKKSWGFSRLEGDFSSWSATDLNCASPAAGADGKVASMFSLNGSIYMMVLEQNSLPDYNIWYVNDEAFPSGCMNKCSPTLWTAAQPTHNTKTNQATADGKFYANAVVNYGQDYAGNDGYVYITGGAWIPSEGNAGYLYMARALTNSNLCAASSWEYLSGPDADQDNIFDGGTPAWTPSIADRTAIFYDFNGIVNAGGGQILWMPTLNRYILMIGHSPGGVGDLGIFEAPEPWGPWSTVFYYDNWCGQGSGESLLYHIVPKWVSKTGLDVTVPIIYSGAPPDSFNLIEGTFTLSDDTGDTTAPDAPRNLRPIP